MENVIKDKNSLAVLNIDRDSLKRYKMERDKRNEHLNRIDNLEKKIAELEQRLNTFENKTTRK